MIRNESNGAREALDELDQYLADSVPPLLVADSVRALISHPSRFLAQHLVSWAATTGRKDSGDVGEPLAKALTRIYQLAHLQLLPKREMTNFLSQFGPILLDACPADARGKIRSVIAQLLEGGPDPASETRPLNFELAEGGAHDTEASTFSDSLARRLVPLLEQMARTLLKEPKTRTPATGQEVVSQLLAAVTRTADTPQQLDERLDKLKNMGLNTDVPSVLRTLGGSVPNWAVVSANPPGSAGPSTAADAGPEASPLLNYSDTRLRAMQRIVELGSAPEESRDRFDHMLQTAVEQFNGGAAGRAVSILESARQLVVQERIPSTQANPLWDKAAEKIQWHRFEVSLPDPVQHKLLCQFLSFFPVLAPVNLLNDLRRKEEDKTGRRLLISLLQVHGDAVRPDIQKRLEFLLEDESKPDWEFTKDLVGVLASISVPDRTVTAEEVVQLTRLAALPVPLSVFRELVRYATQININQSIGLLTTLLEPARAVQLERRAALQGEQGPHWALSFEQILTRLAAAEDSSVHRLVLRYCMDVELSARISTAPLAALGSHDLATEADTLTRLLALLKRNVPSRLTSWIRRPSEYPLLDLVRALSGTSSAQVRSILDQLARRFSNRSFGVAAIKALGGEPGADKTPGKVGKEAAAAGLESDILLLEGELHSFNLPSLIQHLEATAATGLLELLNSAEMVEGKATFVRGQLFHCQAGRLRGKDALYALLEKPVFGRFRVRGSTSSEPGETGPLPVVPTLLEGMKRYDEYQQLRLLVPDDTVFAPTGERPGRPEGEDDAEFVRQVWAEAVFGKTAAQCETSIAADPYRTRRLLAYWMADGVLREVSAANIRRPQQADKATAQ